MYYYFAIFLVFENRNEIFQTFQMMRCIKSKCLRERQTNDSAIYVHRNASWLAWRHMRSPRAAPWTHSNKSNISAPLRRKKRVIIFILVVTLQSWSSSCSYAALATSAFFVFSKMRLVYLVRAWSSSSWSCWGCGVQVYWVTLPRHIRRLAAVVRVVLCVYVSRLVS